jgi:hypothetical protein
VGKFKISKPLSILIVNWKWRIHSNRVFTIRFYLVYDYRSIFNVGARWDLLNCMEYHFQEDFDCGNMCVFLADA